MAEPESLEQLYARQILPALAPLETARRFLVRQAFSTGFLALAAVGAFTFSIWFFFAGAVVASRRMDIAAIAIVWVAGAFLWWVPNRDRYRRYRNGFKGKVIAPLVALGGREIVYLPEHGISEGEFRAAQIFMRAPDSYAAEDLVKGRHVHTRFAFSEVHARYKTTTTDSEGRTQTQWHDLFKGTFFVADFNKHFSGVTVIRPDTAERLLGHIGTSLQALGAKLDKRDGDVVKMDDPDFEREFVVTATDEIEARYILSTSLMRRVLELKAKTGRLALAFHHAKIYLAISSRNDGFEAPSLFKPLTKSISLEVVRAYLADLERFIAIIDELDLNTRIWSKQPTAPAAG